MTLEDAFVHLLTFESRLEHNNLSENQNFGANMTTNQKDSGWGQKKKS